LLATDAISGFERFDVADFAEVAYSVELPIPDSVKPLDLKYSFGSYRSLDPDLAVGQPFVL
jgi:hypothetical protein